MYNKGEILKVVQRWKYHHLYTASEIASNHLYNTNDILLINDMRDMPSSIQQQWQMFQNLKK